MRRYVAFMGINERPVSKIALEGVKRLQSTHDIHLWAVTHCEEDYELAKEYGDAVMVDQYPVGAKFNQGLMALQGSGLEFDYLIQISDDDVVSPAVLDAYEDIDADVIGCKVMYFYHEGKAYKFHYAPNSDGMMGAGRAISRRIIEKCEWQLWGDDQMKGLDFRSEINMRTKGAKFRIVENSGIVDIKTDRNIWGIETYTKQKWCTEVDPEDVRQIVGVKLFNEIEKLCEIQVTN